VFDDSPLGRKTTVSTRVDSTNTASAVGSGGVDVFSTPAMIGLIEKAARDSVQSLLSQGWTTVGTRVDIRHISATPFGEEISATAEVVEVDGRRLVFAVLAADRLGLVGEGTHERFAIEQDAFVSRVRNRFRATGSVTEEESRNG
jgi:fluoroacetyl-CoA thioesterase